MWGRKAFIKYPGTITVSIGEPIATHGLKAEEIISRAENWIEGEMQHLNGKARAA